MEDVSPLRPHLICGGRVGDLESTPGYTGSAAALDFKRTICSNLIQPEALDPERKMILPEHFWFFEHTSQTGTSRWTVILDVDQSGSMGGVCAPLRGYWPAFWPAWQR